MKSTDKITRVLLLYYRLSKGESINKVSFIKEHKVTYRTFDRDIEDIRLFLSEIYTNKELLFDRTRKVYYLTGVNNTEISAIEICSIVKIIINSRAFNKAEMMGIIKSISKLIPIEKQKILNDLIYSEMTSYRELSHGKAILKMNWDLNQCIFNQRKIELLYYKANNEKVKRKVLPLSIVFSEFYFYLIAFIDGKSYDFPAFFRIDRIVSFKLLDEKYSRTIFEKYDVGKMKNSIQFMCAGQLMNVKLRCKKAVLEVVLDKLPNSEIIDIRKDYIILKAEVFGQGLVKWILSQGNSLEVLEPIDLKQKILEETLKILDLYKH